MKIAQFDTKTNSMFTAEVLGPSYEQYISGDGYFIIVNPNSKFVSFSKHKHDICFGDIISDIIKEYTNQQYCDDYGKRLLGTGQTIKEYMINNCRMKLI
jgi:hypothetical protein